MPSAQQTKKWDRIPAQARRLRTPPPVRLARGRCRPATISPRLRASTFPLTSVGSTANRRSLPGCPPARGPPAAAGRVRRSATDIKARDRNAFR